MKSILGASVWLTLSLLAVSCASSGRDLANISDATIVPEGTILVVEKPIEGSIFNDPGYQRIYRSSLSVAQVNRFYQTELTKRGWQLRNMAPRLVSDLGPTTPVDDATTLEWQKDSLSIVLFLGVQLSDEAEGTTQFGLTVYRAKAK